MTDLFVLTADADALAVVRTVLARPQAINIRPITCEVDRHAGRDSGMARDGPELVRMRVQKAAFQKVILIWDHEGSGWEWKSPEQARQEMQVRLNQVTWEDRSAAIVVVPEIEEWLWHNPASLAKHLAVGRQTLRQWTESFVASRGVDSVTCRKCYPKELFRYVLYQKYKRKPLPRDFAQIAKQASLIEWQSSQTFRVFVDVLRAWFPG